jgi:hypothetical protein
MAVEQLIVTDWPAGKGFDPAGTGYQIKACSPGLTAEERFRLLKVAEHYGQAVRLEAPEGRAAEDEWYGQIEGRDAVPQAVLEKFPVIWSYDRISEERHALTRICYLGWTHDGRLGNFFAHALSFPSAALAACNGNPLTLSRSALFRDRDSDAATSLPAIEALGSVPGHDGDSPLRSAPYNKHVAEMISALCQAGPATRPMVVVAPDWRHGVGLLESLLDLLPPATRYRTTCCSCESDRNWLLPSPGGEWRAGSNAAHHVLVINGAGNRQTALRKDEYQSKFAVFNFVAGEFSEVPLRPYAQFAAACEEAANRDRLRAHHGLIDLLGFGEDVDAWDKLVGAVPIACGKVSGDELRAAAQALVSLAREPGQAQAVFDLLLRRLESEWPDGEDAGLTALASSMATLTGRIPEGLPKETSSAVLELAARALREKRVALAESLLAILGNQRDAGRFSVVEKLLAEPGPGFVDCRESDRIPMLEFLLAAMSFGQKSSAAKLPQLALACFRAAVNARRAPETWTNCRNVIDSLLGGEWNDEKRKFAADLAALLTQEQCPEANVYLNLRLLKASSLSPASLAASLEQIARTAVSTSNPDQAIEEIIAIARSDAAGGPPQRAEVMGRLANAVQGSAMEQQMFAEYQAALGAANNRKDDVRRALASGSAFGVLAREALTETVPWQDKAWKGWAPLLLAHPALLDAVRARASAWLEQQGETEPILPLLRHLLVQSTEKAGTDAGTVALYRALARVLPLEPLSDDSFALIREVPAGSAPADKLRLGIMKLMREVEGAAKGENWSLTQFPMDTRTWKDAGELEKNDKDRAIAWCLSLASRTDSLTFHEVRAFANIIEPVAGRSVPKVGDAIHRLIAGRDKVTAVLVGVALADCAVEWPKQDWAEILNDIVRGFDSENRKLLQQHLEGRIGKRAERFRAASHRLYESLGWTQPKTPPPQERGSAAANDGDPGFFGSLWKKIRNTSDDASKASEKSDSKRK